MSTPVTKQTYPDWFYKVFPFMLWWPNVNRQTMRLDLMAGLTGAVVVLPQGVAFATIAGMPPEYGLYAGMVPAIVAALWGSSWHLVSGPTTAASVVLYSSLSVYAEPASMDFVVLALTLTFMVGVIQLIMGLARMGALVNFISHSVIVGFTAGAAILIASKQLKNFFGVEMSGGGHLNDVLVDFAMQIPNINPYVTSVALVTMFSGIALKRWYPKFPYMIIAMLVGSLMAFILNQIFGAAVTGIAVVGALPDTLPPLSSPSFSMGVIKDLAPVALAVTLFALTEAVSIGRSIGARSGQRINGSQEFIGQGMSNIAGSFFSGYVATGSFNRSGLNYQSGAKTPLAAVFAGSMLVVIVLMVAPYAAFLPKAAMAGILFLVAWGLIDFKELGHIWHSNRSEISITGVTLFGALFLELEFAIFAGVLLSLVLYLMKVSKPRIVTRTPDPRLEKNAFSSDPDLPQCPQLRFLRIDGSLFFGSANHVQDALAKIEDQYPDQKHLAINAAGINFADIQGGSVLVKEAKRRHKNGGNLYLIHVTEGLWNSLEACGCLDEMGARNVFQSKESAIRAIYQKLDKSICKTCTRRIFWECQTDKKLKLQ